MPAPHVTWFNGSLIPHNAPAILPDDAGFLRGHGAFETLRLTSDGPFALTRHLRRLAHSARLLGLPEPPLADIRDAATTVTTAAHHQPGVMRITYTAGPPTPQPTPSLLVTARPAPTRPPTARVIRSRWVRNSQSALAGAKSTSYGDSVVALAEAAQAGADEALLANHAGALCEGAVSNVWMMVDNELHTPPLSDGPLPGITRELILQWCTEESIPAHARSIPLADVAHTPGMAISSSLRGLVPVTHCDNTPVPAHHIISTVADLYQRRSAADIDP